jgi:hypothetical protein
MSKSIEMMGRAGETIIVNYCTAAGQKVTVSEDQYDSQKDMIIDGLKVEVKTQVPYIYKNAFSFKPNQLRKCKNADRVIFISVPSKEKPHHSDGKVYLIKSTEMKHYPYKTKDGRDMIAVPIDQEDMDELFTLTEKQCILLQSYSVSGWN